MLRRINFLDTKPSVIWCDSQAAIAIVYRAELNATRSYPRNAAVRIMHVREAVSNGEITIRYVHGLGLVGLAVDGLGVVGGWSSGWFRGSRASSGWFRCGWSSSPTQCPRTSLSPRSQVRYHNSQRQQHGSRLNDPFSYAAASTHTSARTTATPAAVHTYLWHLYHDTPLRPPATHSTSHTLRHSVPPITRSQPP
jgi:hypothetical protein